MSILLAIENVMLFHRIFLIYNWLGQIEILSKNIVCKQYFNFISVDCFEKCVLKFILLQSIF